MIVPKLIEGRVVMTDTRFDPLYGGGPPPTDAINADPSPLLGGTGIIQGLPDGSLLVRPLAQFNNSTASDDAGPINDALQIIGGGVVLLRPCL